MPSHAQKNSHLPHCWNKMKPFILSCGQFSSDLKMHELERYNNLQSHLFCRLESPTRSLYMEAPKGVKIEADAGDFQATCRSDLRLESKDGEVTVLHSRLILFVTVEGMLVKSSLCSDIIINY